MIDFVKAHTNGNDFIILKDILLTKDQVKFLANRNIGIGCDQLIIINQTSSNNYTLKFFNHDGSEAVMCGNGACASCIYVKNYLNALIHELELTIDGRLYKAEIIDNSVNLLFPLPILRSDNVISTGNYHIVLPMNRIPDLTHFQHKFPDCNIHFINKVDENKVKMKTYEVGSGWTLSCGSGAIAVGFYLNSSERLTVLHEGGQSQVQLVDNKVRLTTHPNIVFKGSIGI